MSLEEKLLQNLGLISWTHYNSDWFTAIPHQGHLGFAPLSLISQEKISSKRPNQIKIQEVAFYHFLGCFDISNKNYFDSLHLIPPLENQEICRDLEYSDYQNIRIIRLTPPIPKPLFNIITSSYTYTPKQNRFTHFLTSLGLNPPPSPINEPSTQEIFQKWEYFQHKDWVENGSEEPLCIINDIKPCLSYSDDNRGASQGLGLLLPESLAQELFQLGVHDAQKYNELVENIFKKHFGYLPPPETPDYKGRSLAKKYIFLAPPEILPAGKESPFNCSYDHLKPYYNSLIPCSDQRKNAPIIKYRMVENAI